METTLSIMTESLANAMKPVTEPFELAALWLKRVRYTKGDYIRLNEDKNPFKDKVEYLIHKSESNPTHRITKVSGLLNDTKHWMELKNLDNGEVLTIEI